MFTKKFELPVLRTKIEPKIAQVAKVKIKNMPRGRSDLVINFMIFLSMEVL